MNVLIISFFAGVLLASLVSRQVLCKRVRGGASATPSEGTVTEIKLNPVSEPDLRRELARLQNREQEYRVFSLRVSVLVARLQERLAKYAAVNATHPGSVGVVSSLNQCLGAFETSVDDFVRKSDIDKEKTIVMLRPEHQTVRLINHGGRFRAQ